MAKASDVADELRVPKRVDMRYVGPMSTLNENDPMTLTQDVRDQKQKRIRGERREYMEAIYLEEAKNENVSFEEWLVNNPHVVKEAEYVVPTEGKSEVAGYITLEGVGGTYRVPVNGNPDIIQINVRDEEIALQIEGYRTIHIPKRPLISGGNVRWNRIEIKPIFKDDTPQWDVKLFGSLDGNAFQIQYYT